jgi:large subunit ribosomal protein L14
VISKGSVLRLADNSGVKRLKVIGIPGSSARRFAGVGDIITASVSGVSAGSPLKDHTIVRAIIVRTKKEVRRRDGSYIRFGDNAAVIVNKDKMMVGTRVFGPVAREIRDAGYLKIASLAKEVW